MNNKRVSNQIIRSFPWRLRGLASRLPHPNSQTVLCDGFVLWIVSDRVWHSLPRCRTSRLRYRHLCHNLRGLTQQLITEFGLVTSFVFIHSEAAEEDTESDDPICLISDQNCTNETPRNLDCHFLSCKRVSGVAGLGIFVLQAATQLMTQVPCFQQRICVGFGSTVSGFMFDILSGRFWVRRHGWFRHVYRTVFALVHRGYRGKRLVVWRRLVWHLAW